MKTILVDDERYGLERFEIECGQLEDVELVGKFRNPLQALEFARSNRVDLAFLDIEMPIMNGLELSDKLRELYPEVIIVFVSAYDEYMPDAFKTRGADYYIVKPYTNDEVQAVLTRAKLLSRRFAKRIYIETFGRFNVFIDGKPVKFTSGYAKQLLALMVDRRGLALSNQEAFYLLWEDRSYNHTTVSALHHALQRLKETLTAAGIDGLVVPVPPNAHKVDVTLFDCDYYQFLDKDPAAIKKFKGEYMSEWTWGEERIGQFFDIASNT